MTRRCSDPLNRGCVTILSRYNPDDLCAPCQAAEARRLTTLQPASGARDRKTAITTYLDGREASSSMIGAALRISYTEVRRLVQVLQRDGRIRRVAGDGPGGVARYTATSDEPEAAA